MMEVSKGNPSDTFVDIGSSVVSFQKLLASQKDLLHSQVNQLQKIVVTQCSLTGANPLSQEMAAGSLSIKIGKRPRDLLNPKAVKYMQSVFSIKDVISKKESREISALCGVTITQVREFFAGQRSRVRKFVRFSKEKVVRSNASRASLDGCSVGSDSAMCIDQDLVNSKDSKAVGEVPSCLSQEEALPVIDNSDKNFLENIFNLMRKEETFIGQVRLIEWILQIENSSVLYWFLTKGGLMILTTWLSQAALEEQTTVLRIIFKVLCHLPLHKTLPVHMSAVLQSVNRLRFYRIPDVSNRARELLAKWSKLFARSQALKKPTSMKLPNAAQKEIIQKQRKGEILCDESWQSKADIPGEILSLTFDGSENSRKSEPPSTLKLLTASADATNRGHIRSVSSHKTRERRKILLVEQPGQKTSSRNPQVGRALPLMQGRPISSDDIQKAKMRAQFMQSKYGKIESSSNDDHKRQKLEDPMKLHESGRSNMPSSSKTPVQLNEENAIPAVLPSTIPPSKSVATIAPKSTLDHQEYSQERFRREQTSWLTPPEVRINSLWRIGTGESSKEIEVQIERIRREKGTIYHSNQEIPPNPKEPWDIEIDYDDSLTPEIPIEQPLDADVTESVSSAIDKGKTPDASAASVAATSKEYCPPVATSSPEYYPTVATTIGKQSCPPVASTSNGSAPEPDLELLAVLLNNPQLVFALTSGQGGSVPDAETVRLLDMIKASGIGLPGMVGGKAEEKVEVTSLPSPTPGSDHSMGGWRSEVGKDRFPQPVSAPVNDSVVTSSIPSSGKHFPGGSVQHQIPYQNFFPPQISNVVPQQHQNAFGAVLPERQHSSSTPFLSQQSSNPTIHPFQLNPINETVLPAKQSSYTSSAPLQAECRGFGQLYNPNPATVLIERPPTALQPLPASLRHQPTPYQPLLAEAPPIQSLHNTWQPNATGSGRRAFVSAPQNVRQFAVSSNHYQANQNNHNVHSHGNVGEPELETWSPEGSPVRPPSYQSGRNFHQPRSDYGWNSRRDHQSRQNNPGYRERRHDRRWRERRH